MTTLYPNALRGEAAIIVDGQSYRVWYGWPGVQLLQQEFGPAFDQVITAAIAETDLPVLAKALAIGMREGGLSADEIAAASPPVNNVTATINLALRRTFMGDESKDGSATPDANPPRRLRALRGMLFWKG